MKNTNKNYFQPVAEQHYKKSFLLRKVKEEEAEEEIKDFDGEYSEEFPTKDSDYNRLT